MSESYHIPGKVFLLGEYGVLRGGSACVVTIGPRFRLSCIPADHQGVVFHEESPLGCLQSWVTQQGICPLSFYWEDPFLGQGGFGASSAQFALAYRAYAERYSWDQHWKSVWTLYRELTQGSALQPSGADLIAQWQGGMSWIHFGTQHIENHWPLVDGAELWVFSATLQKGRKVATHHHLDAVSTLPLLEENSTFLKKLDTITQLGWQAIHQAQPQQLGICMNDTAEHFREAGLELPVTSLDRQAFQKIPGVLGVKGTGALQADGLVVLVSPHQVQVQHLLEVAQQRGLRSVAQGLTYQPGITCQIDP